MAFPSMHEFFINQARVEELPHAPNDRKGVRHIFPYENIPDGVKLLYHHYGQMVWSQPVDENIRVLLLCCRIPEKSSENDYYQVLAFEKSLIAGVFNNGKISPNSIRQGLELPNEFNLKVDADKIQKNGVNVFRGYYPELCSWIDSFAENDKAKKV